MKIKQIGRHASVVRRLRDPLVDYDGKPDGAKLIEKINAIGEALAYIIEKKHAKRKMKKARKQRRL